MDVQATLMCLAAKKCANGQNQPLARFAAQEGGTIALPHVLDYSFYLNRLGIVKKI
jgi:hypothetical protein